jgi:hypothetical protein
MSFCPKIGFNPVWTELKAGFEKDCFGVKQNALNEIDYNDKNFFKRKEKPSKKKRKPKHSHPGRKCRAGTPLNYLSFCQRHSFGKTLNCGCATCFGLAFSMWDGLAGRVANFGFLFGFFDKIVEAAIG